MQGQETELLVGPVTDDLINVEEYREESLAMPHLFILYRPHLLALQWIE